MGIQDTLKEKALLSADTAIYQLAFPVKPIAIAELLELKVRDAFDCKEFMQFSGSAEYESHFHDSLYASTDAYTKKPIFVLINDVQIDTLEEEVSLSDQSTITLIRLVPLVGG